MKKKDILITCEKCKSKINIKHAYCENCGKKNKLRDTGVKEIENLYKIKEIVKKELETLKENLKTDSIVNFREGYYLDIPYIIDIEWMNPESTKQPYFNKRYINNYCYENIITFICLAEKLKKYKEIEIITATHWPNSIDECFSLNILYCSDKFSPATYQLMQINFYIEFCTESFYKMFAEHWKDIYPRLKKLEAYIKDSETVPTKETATNKILSYFNNYYKKEENLYEIAKKAKEVSKKKEEK